MTAQKFKRETWDTILAAVPGDRKSQDLASTISKRVGVSVTTTKRYLTEMQARGLVLTENRTCRGRRERWFGMACLYWTQH